MDARSQFLLGPLSRESRLIEIGPSHRPTASKADGWNVCNVDHLDREGLIEKYTGHGIDLDAIEDVDCIWHGGPLCDAVPKKDWGSFDALIASHMIEHTPDMLAFLQSCEELLKPNGVVILAVPDKRYCFDFFQPLTMAGDVLAAHKERRSCHTPQSGFNYLAYTALSDGSIAWGQHPITNISLAHTLPEAWAMFKTLDTATGYVDMHSWRFTPASFQVLMIDLAATGNTDWQVSDISEARGSEFFAWLRRGGAAATSSMPFDVLQAKRVSLLKQVLMEMSKQIEWMIEGDQSSPSML